MSWNSELETGRELPQERGERIARNGPDVHHRRGPSDRPRRSTNKQQTLPLRVHLPLDLGHGGRATVRGKGHVALQPPPGRDQPADEKSSPEGDHKKDKARQGQKSTGWLGVDEAQVGRWWSAEGDVCSLDGVRVGKPGGGSCGATAREPQVANGWAALPFFSRFDVHFFKMAQKRQ